MRVAAPKQGRAAQLLSWSRKSPKARTLRVADRSVRSWLGALTERREAASSARFVPPESGRESTASLGTWSGRDDPGCEMLRNRGSTVGGLRIDGRYHGDTELRASRLIDDVPTRGALLDEVARLRPGMTAHRRERRGGGRSYLAQGSFS